MTDRFLPNWIQGYLAYTSESESPEEYHRWVAISVLAGVLRRRVYFDMGYYTLFPNDYIVLVGPPGRCKKSTAMRIGRGLLATVQAGIKFTTDSVTRERLIQDLTQAFTDGHSSMTAYSSEFATLLTSSGMDMVSFLTDIYDCPPIWEHSSKSGGTNKIKAPYLNLIAATTPDWIAKAMPMDTVGIGLTSRIVFVYQDTPRVKDPFPTLSQDQLELYKLLVHDLNVIAMLGGESTISPDGRAYYTEWYKARVANTNPTGDSRLNGYFERKHAHVLKVAIALSASTKNELELQVEDIEAAIGFLDQVEAKMPKVFANVGRNVLSADIDDVYLAIISAGDGGLPMKAISLRFKHALGQKEMVEVMETLLIQERVKLISDRGHPRYVAIDII